MKRRIPGSVVVLSVLALVAGIALLLAAFWLAPFATAEAADRGGNLDDALKYYAASEKRFEAVPATKRVLPTVFDASQANQVRVLYLMSQFDAAIEKAGSSGATHGVHFWTGCSLFQKAHLEEKDEARLGWLSRAEEEFHKALEIAPDDWDTRYNYELTRRLLAELRKQPKTPPKQMMQLLRPQPKTGNQPAKRIG